MKKILVIILLFLTLFASAQCPSGQTEVTIDVGTDNWGEEIYWELAPSGSSCGSSSTIFSGGNSVVGCNSNSATSGGYPDNTTTNEGPWCLTAGATYDIISRDGYGDGGADFVVNITTYPLYVFTASSSSETFSFSVNPPPAIDAPMEHFEIPAYVFIGNIDIKAASERNITVTFFI